MNGGESGNVLVVERETPRILNCAVDVVGTGTNLECDGVIFMVTTRMWIAEQLVMVKKV